MIRVTTNGALKSYRFNLMQSSNNRNDAQNTVLTGRNFNSYAEDPALASRCFQLRRSYQRVESQTTVANSVVSKFEVAWATLDSVVGNVSNTKGNSALTSIIEGASDPSGAGRNALGTELEQTAKSIVHAMNAKYGDNFVFAGADGLNVPFVLGEDGCLTYRGIDVNSETGSPDFNTLDYLVKEEKKFADIGLGMQEGTDGELIETSAFNVSLHGITFLGYGTDTVELDDGTDVTVPKNIASIIYEMGQVLQRCDASGNFREGASEGAKKYDPATTVTDEEYFDALFEQFSKAEATLEQKHVEMDTEAEFLKSNVVQLETQSYTLLTQYATLEDVDQADAITAYSWAQYSYNAALRVGNSILSESLMDYINN